MAENTDLHTDAETVADKLDDAEGEPDEVTAEDVTVEPFYDVRATGTGGTVVVRAGWEDGEGTVHTLAIQATVALANAQAATNLAQAWYARKLQVLAASEGADGGGEAEE